MVLDWQCCSLSCYVAGAPPPTPQSATTSLPAKMLSDPLLAAESTSARELVGHCQSSPALLSMSILLRPCLLSTSSAGRLSSPAVGSVVCMSSTAIASGARSWKGTLGACILHKGHQTLLLAVRYFKGMLRPSTAEHAVDVCPKTGMSKGLLMAAA